MGQKIKSIPPRIEALLSDLGENIKLARLRRKITTTMLSERAGMTRKTLRAIEKGEMGVSMGAYANVLFCLGLQDDLAAVARVDEFGRRLQDAALVQKKSRPSK
jgi:transcriptional regulator with XRE-family HTH domain